jgi:hypothetical protein
MPQNSWRSDLAHRLARTIALTAALMAPAVATAQPRPVESLGWFTGCWERRTPAAVIEEQWSSARGGVLIGFGKTTVRDTVREYEFLRIYAAGDTLVYHAQPSRQQPAEFRALPPFDSVVTFANPAHDFPQRIIYRRAGGDSLRARIEGTRNGQPRGVDYSYARAACK